MQRTKKRRRKEHDEVIRDFIRASPTTLASVEVSRHILITEAGDGEEGCCLFIENAKDGRFVEGARV